MSATAIIQLDRSIVESLNKIKEYPGQSYDELIVHMVKVFKTVEIRNQYDEFLHKIQQHKMRELWDNEYDEGLDNHS